MIEIFICLKDTTRGQRLTDFDISMQVMLKYATTHNHPQSSTTICNHPQPSTAIHSIPQPRTIIHNHPQLPKKPPTITYNHPQQSTTTQKLSQTPKTYHKQLQYCTQMLILKQTLALIVI